MLRSFDEGLFSNASRTRHTFDGYCTPLMVANMGTMSAEPPTGLTSRVNMATVMATMRHFTL